MYVKGVPIHLKLVSHEDINEVCITLLGQIDQIVGEAGGKLFC
jgi:hypothetical protein